MSDEFYEWLDECPVQWSKIGDTPEDTTYSFTKEDEEEE